MKKVFLVFLELAFFLAFVQAKEPSKPVNFSGNWLLNFGETKNPPAGLQAYSLVVNQDQQHLKVGTSLEGDLQRAQDVRNSGSYPGGTPGGYPGRRGGMGGGLGLPGRIGIGMPGGGMGIPGGRGGGRPRGEGPAQGNVVAYKLYPPSAVYKLDGSESTATLGDPQQSGATSKAAWAKNGKELKLSLAGNGDSGQRGSKIQLKEQWKLSEDGKSLRIDRSIKSPEGSGTVHLVFFRK